MTAPSQLSLLVKAQALPPALGLSFAGAQLSLSATPLMPSIDQAHGLGVAGPARWHQVKLSAWQGSAWDACHSLIRRGGLSIGAGVEFAEPDQAQQWLYDGNRTRDTELAAQACSAADPQNNSFPVLPDNDWYRDDEHGQFLGALAQLGANPQLVRVAHLDTGFDPLHQALPLHLRKDLGRNFVDDPWTNDASDQTDGILNNRGHGTGTLSILAGRDPSHLGGAIGAAPFVEVVPVRVANRVVLFFNSSIAKAFDYVHQLCGDPGTVVHVVTMSMGGLASAAWADAVNALYNRGVFVVTAAGNNFGNFPTREIVYPARFNRVVAACGVMANGRPYADLPLALMAGNYGPTSKMTTAIAAYTPNTPWARLGCEEIVDHDGAGTSAATPQVAAAAGLWISKNLAIWSGYPQDWMRVEAVRAALFQSATKKDPTHFGAGLLQAKASLGVKPAAGSLTRQDPDNADFAVLRLLTGPGVQASPDARQRMLELEALQLAQTSQNSHLVPDQGAHPSRTDATAIAKALIADPRASETLRTALQQTLGAAVTATGPAAPAPSPKTAKSVRGPVPPAAVPAPKALPKDSQSVQDRQLDRARAPPLDRPKRRKLQAYAYDPALGSSLETFGLNTAILEVKWEPLEPGPVGEYLEVVDVDPASRACYAPVNLDDPYLLAEQGLAPSETDPRFHQQMVYAVASRTIEFFERALGRVALWAPRLSKTPAQFVEQYIPRLRIYPHALRAANAYYSPDKKALLLGYFDATDADPYENAPGSLIFAALSHDIVAHETTHALLDGLHRRYTEATNPDVLAFHEAFADIAALFQHFTLPEALRDQIARTRGDLGRQNLLGQLAVQFGHAIGSYGALRDSIGSVDDKGVWQPHKPSTADYESSTEPHARGAVLVAAVFDAFLQLYRRATADLIRLATGGTGIVGEGALSADLTDRLAQEAARIAGHCLEICIRALDYCPPIDITFGEYLRALITADRDIAPEDPYGYRVAFVAAFRARGITPAGLRSLSAESLAWEPPPQPLCQLSDIIRNLSLDWDLTTDREHAWRASRVNAAKFQRWLVSNAVADDELAMLGLVRHGGPLTLNNVPGTLGGIEVHSVRPARRIGPDRRSRAELIVEITQTWRPVTPAPGALHLFLCGCTLVVNLEQSVALYLVRKRVDHDDRLAQQTNFQAISSVNTLRANYFDDQTPTGEPFAALHEAR